MARGDTTGRNQELGQRRQDGSVEGASAADAAYDSLDATEAEDGRRRRRVRRRRDADADAGRTPSEARRRGESRRSREDAADAGGRRRRGEGRPQEHRHRDAERSDDAAGETRRPQEAPQDGREPTGRTRRSEDPRRRGRRKAETAEPQGERRRRRPPVEDRGRREAYEEEPARRDERAGLRGSRPARRFGLRPLTDDEIASNPWIEERDKPQRLRKRRRRRPRPEPVVEVPEATLTQDMDTSQPPVAVPIEDDRHEAWDERPLEVEDRSFEVAPDVSQGEPEPAPQEDVDAYARDERPPHHGPVPEDAGDVGDAGSAQAGTDIHDDLTWDDEEEFAPVATSGAEDGQGRSSGHMSGTEGTGDAEAPFGGGRRRESHVEPDDVFALAWQRRSRSGGRTFSDLTREREQASYGETYADDFEEDLEESRLPQDVFERARSEEDALLDEVVHRASEPVRDEVAVDEADAVGGPDGEPVPEETPAADVEVEAEDLSHADSLEQDAQTKETTTDGRRTLWTDAPNVGTVAQPSIPRVFLFEDMVNSKGQEQPAPTGAADAGAEDRPPADGKDVPVGLAEEHEAPVDIDDATAEPDNVAPATDETYEAGPVDEEPHEDDSEDAYEAEAWEEDEPEADYEPEADHEPVDEEDAEDGQESVARGHRPSFFARVREGLRSVGSREVEPEPEDEEEPAPDAELEEEQASVPEATSASETVDERVPTISSDDEVVSGESTDEPTDEDYDEEDYEDEEDYDEEPLDEDAWYEPFDEDGGARQGTTGHTRVSMPRPDHSGTGPVVSHKVSWQRSWKSRNLTDGRRPKGRSHVFLVFYLLLVCALVGFGGFAFYHTYDSLVRYERSRASSFMDSLVNDLQAGGEVARRREASIVGSLKLSAHDDLELLNNRLDRGVARSSYRLEQLGHPGDAIDPVYTLFVDDAPYLSLTLHARESYVRLAMLPITDWEIADAYVFEEGAPSSALANPGGAQSLDISVAPDCVAYVNGQALTDTDLAENSGVLAGFEYASQFVEVPAAKTYHVDGLHTSAQVWATDASGNPIELERSGDTYRATSLTVPNTEPADLPVDVLEVAETWSRFMTADLGGPDVNYGLGQVTAFLVPGSDLYETAVSYAKGVDITFVVNHTLDSFSEETITNCVMYNDHLFSCDVHFLKNVTLTATETMRSDVFDNSMIFAYIDNVSVVPKPGWYLVSMQPKGQVA